MAKTLDYHLASLSEILTQKQPARFGASWIIENAPKTYRFLWRNVRTENGTVDWDRITSSLDREFQKKWMRYRHAQVKAYEKQSEVDSVLDRYRDRLYTFICALDKDDKKFQQVILIRLVRIGQKGNVLARDEVVKWVTYITDDWIDRYPQMHRWKGYADEVEDKIRSCIRCYRYTGSFLGYLFRTLEYSARGKPPLVSLDDKMFGSNKTREEFAIVQEDWQIYKR